MSRIIPRAEWGAKYRAGFGARPVGRLDKWLHHSVTQAPDMVAPFDDDYAAVRTLEKIGQDRFEGGISYTFVVTPAGLIFEGTGVSRVGAHTAGRNTGSAGIVLVGNYDRDNPPQPMLEAVAWVLRHGVAQGWWQVPALTGGHRDTKGTACPGARAYAQIRSINQLAGGGGALAPAAPPTQAAPSQGRPVLVYGSRGPVVGELQRFLGINEDNSFGPATLRAVKAYQKRVGLNDDGSVGPLTWAKIAAGEGRPGAAAAKPGPRLTADGNLWLDEDGSLGRATIARWQQIMGTPIDEVISPVSSLIKAVQKRIGMAAKDQDGRLGPKTIRALQKYLGTPQDGVISTPRSSMVVALQKRLNDGRF